MVEEKSNLKALVFPTVGILAIVLAYFLIDFNAVLQSLKGEAKFIVQDEKCDLKESSCLVKIQDGTTFELDIDPRTIPLMKAIKFKVKSNNHELKGLHLNIYATNMMMGELNTPLKNLGNGNYESIVTLPTCIAGKMHWNTDIRVEKFNETIGARFQFKTD